MADGSEKIILAVSGHRVLYDLSAEGYRNINIKAMAWEDVARTAGKTGEVGEPGPTIDPRKHTESPQTCERERAWLLSHMRPPWQVEFFIPECTAEGRYSPDRLLLVCEGGQRHGTASQSALGQRWHPQTGGTGRNLCLVNATFQFYHHKGCPGARKKHLLQSLVRALQLEAEHAGTLSPYRASDTPPSSTPSSSFNTSTSAPSPSSPGVFPPVAREPIESSRPEGVLRWHFSQLDLDSSGVLSKSEARPLRHFLRRKLSPRRCAKKFSQYCDRDGDRGLTLDQLRACLGL
ncbi:SPARC-related modular calcium-binding protein 2-like isoform X1 [Eleginops maclovinus]|uniref:SPARC-related modular calcium-binding protein 2-like isoform X1 n=1 Tax=Eleginops maclovinus TaxID=56733 RepID=UPI0030810835